MILYRGSSCLYINGRAHVARRWAEFAYARARAKVLLLLIGLFNAIGHFLAITFRIDFVAFPFFSLDLELFSLVQTGGIWGVDR